MSKVVNSAFRIERGDFIYDESRLMHLLVIDVLIPLRVGVPIVLALDELNDLGKWVLHEPGIKLVARAQR